MKKLYILILLAVSVILSWQCGNSNKTGEQPAAATANKKRESQKKIKTLKEYKIGLNDTLRGFLLNEEHFNEKGWMLKSIGYDYYGSGAINSTIEITYNEQGKRTKYAQTYDGVTTTTTYTYDEKGNIATEQWSRPNGEGEKTEYIFTNGKIAEEKHFDQNGKYTFSRVYEYVLDDKGRVSNEKKIEKYTDGTPPLEQYSISYSYYDNDSLKEKKSLRGDGSCCASHTTYEYDAAWNLAKEIQHDNSGVESITFTFYNEYGEYIIDSVWTGNKEDFQYSNNYRWDEYGTKVFHFYKHVDGDLWGSRYEVEYW